jgi:hypothetical protein
MLPTRDDIGRAVSPEEEKKLLARFEAQDHHT